MKEQKFNQGLVYVDPSDNLKNTAKKFEEFQ